MDSGVWYGEVDAGEKAIYQTDPAPRRLPLVLGVVVRLELSRGC